MDKTVVSLTYTLDGQYHQTILSAIDNTSVTLSSTITKQPLANGTYVSDHMYREPITYDVSGQYSVNGDCFYDTIFAKPSIEQFQMLFEKINKQGIVMEIVKGSYHEGLTSDTFVSRNQMVLDSITWTEAINSVSFRFGFTEVLRASAKSVKPLDSENLQTDDQLTSNAALEGFTYARALPQTIDSILTAADLTRIVYNTVINKMDENTALQTYGRQYAYGNTILDDNIALIAAAIIGGKVGSFSGPEGAVIGTLLGASVISMYGGFEVANRYADFYIHYGDQTFKYNLERTFVEECLKVLTATLNQCNGYTIDTTNLGKTDSVITIINFDNATVNIKFVWNATQNCYNIQTVDANNIVLKDTTTKSAIRSLPNATVYDALARSSNGHYLYMVEVPVNYGNGWEYAKNPTLENYAFLDFPMSPKELCDRYATVIKKTFYVGGQDPNYDNREVQ